MPSAEYVQSTRMFEGRPSRCGNTADLDILARTYDFSVDMRDKDNLAKSLSAETQDAASLISPTLVFQEDVLTTTEEHDQKAVLLLPPQDIPHLPLFQFEDLRTHTLDEVPAAQQIQVLLPLVVNGIVIGRVSAPQHALAQTVCERLQQSLQETEVAKHSGVWEDHDVIYCTYPVSGGGSHVNSKSKKGTHQDWSDEED
eukprot:5444495-Amphidinium_carterae.1